MVSDVTKPRSGHLPREVVWFAIVMGSLSLLAMNTGLTLVGVLLVPIFFLLLWRAGEPPALLFAVGFQWLQVFLPVMNANISAIDMGRDTFTPELDVAAYLGFTALLFLALGMHIGRGRRALDSQNAVLSEFESFTVGKLILAYLLAHILAFGAEQLGSASAGLRQPLLALQVLRWVVVFLVLWAGIADSRFRLLAVGVFFFELGLGFMGFFSGFKFVMFMAIVISLAQTRDPRRLIRPRVVLLAGFVLVFATYWQAIKEDYREFLNQGTGMQTILVSPGERIGFLANSLLNLDMADLEHGFESGIERTGYLEFFAHSINVVPDQIDYQNGRLWSEAISHVFMPRLLFPEKEAINDSERVNEFSGLNVAGAEQGTSISLGYVAESYIDYGPVLMFVPIFLLGMFWGWTYRVLATTGPYRLLSLSFATSFILSGAILFESSNIKVVGGAVTAFLMSWLLLRFGSKHLWSLVSHTRVRIMRLRTDVVRY